MASRKTSKRPQLPRTLIEAINRYQATAILFGSEKDQEAKDEMLKARYALEELLLPWAKVIKDHPGRFAAPTPKDQLSLLSSPWPRR